MCVYIFLICFKIYAPHRNEVRALRGALGPRRHLHLGVPHALNNTGHYHSIMSYGM